MKTLPNPVFLSLIVIGSAAIAQADTYNWNGITTGGLGGTSNTWDTTTANWTGFGTIWPAVSTTNDDAVFAGTPGTVTLTTAVTANSITFSQAINTSYTIGADNTTGVITLDGTTPTVTSAGSASLNSIGAVLSGSAGLTKAGNRTLQVRGASNYTGDTQVLQGILLLGLLNNRLPTSTNLILGDAATDTSGVFQMNSRSQQVGGLETAGAGTGNRVINSSGSASTFTVANTTNQTFGGILGGATANDNNFNLAKLGLGAFTLTNNNTYTGTTTVGLSRPTGPTYVSSGSLRLAHNNAAGAGTIVINGGFEAGRIELAGGVSVSNAVTLEGRQGATWPAVVNFSDDNTFSGNINVVANGARLTFRSDAGKLTVSGAPMTGATERILTLRGVATGEFAKNITTAVVGSIEKTDAGTWTLSGTNTYAGNTTVNGGTLVLAATSSTRFLPKSDASSNKITGNGSAITLNGLIDIDLTDAALAPDATSWLLVDVDNVAETYDPNFTVTGFTEDPVNSGIWKNTVSPSTYTFTESDGRLVKTAAAGSPFSIWMTTNFPLVTPNGAGDDPDGDGVNNLAEFAFSGNPGDGSNNGLIRFGIEDVGGTDHLTYTFACRSGAIFTGTAPANASQDGVDYSVRASLDLSAFTLSVSEVSPAITTGLPAVPSGYTYRTFRVTDPQGTNPKAFIQVKTSATAP